MAAPIDFCRHKKLDQALPNFPLLSTRAERSHLRPIHPSKRHTTPFPINKGVCVRRQPISDMTLSLVFHKNALQSCRLKKRLRSFRVPEPLVLLRQNYYGRGGGVSFGCRLFPTSGCSRPCP